MDTALTHRRRSLLAGARSVACGRRCRAGGDRDHLRRRGLSHADVDHTSGDDRGASASTGAPSIGIPATNSSTPGADEPTGQAEAREISAPDPQERLPRDEAPSGVQRASQPVTECPVEADIS